MKIKDIIKLVAISIVINVASMVSGAFTWINQLLITSMLFFIAGSILPLYFKEKKLILTYLIVLTPFLSIYSLYVLRAGAVNVYPIAFAPLLFFPLGNLIAYINKKIKILLLIGISGIIILVAYVGMPNWLSYVGTNKSITYNINNNQLRYFDQEDNIKVIGKNEGKITVIDFWGSYCSVCYKKFPEFEQLMNKYDSTKTEFVAIHLLTKRETIKDAKEKVDNLNYKFQLGYTTMDQSNTIKEKLSINAVPTLIICDTQGEIIYKGELITSETVYINNANRIIESLLKKN